MTQERAEANPPAWIKDARGRGMAIVEESKRLSKKLDLARAAVGSSDKKVKEHETRYETTRTT